MQVLDMIIAPLILLLIMVVAYGFVLGGGESSIVKKLIRWIVIFIIATVLCRMFVPHG